MSETHQLQSDYECHHHFNDSGDEIFPGWGLCIDHEDEGTCSHLRLIYHNPVDWQGTLLAVNEVRMIEVMQQLMEKPEWALGQDNFSEQMWRYCVAELRDKAEVVVRTGIVTAINVDAEVVYSDRTIEEETAQELIRAVAPLEDVPDHLKDWHPGSGERVLDLVHPSLFPLVYGRSRVLETGTVGLEDCSSYCGQGETITKNDHFDNLWSVQFQWLPCEVKFEGEDDMKITSYINNLHPREHPDLYRVVEKIIAKSVPLWNQVCNHTGGGGGYYYMLGGTHGRHFAPRIHINNWHFEEPYGDERPLGWRGGNLPTTQEAEAALQALVDAHDPAIDKEEAERPLGIDSWELDEEWKRNMRILHGPHPREYEPRTVSEETPLDLRKEYKEDVLQVIVKLADIHLTPEKPDWDGGSWHVEGLLNEHIVATSIFYYDSSNITDSYLAFRQNCNEEIQHEIHYEQGDWDHIETITGFRNEEDNLSQQIGKVLCKQGRLLAFPNVLQHSVSAFSLADKTKPGHRKILALFLVDPHVRILSTAKVPPQQEHWWKEELERRREDIKGLQDLPNELMAQVYDEVDDFPIKMDEAKEIREALMAERGPISEQMIETEASFYFCEH